MTRIKKIHILLSLATLGATSSSADNLDDISRLSLEELLKIPVEVATKRPVALNRSPSTVSIFTQDDIRKRGIESLADLLKHIPGFYSMYNSVEGNQSYLVTRGNATKYASTVLFLHNGQRLNEDYTGGINFLMQYLQLDNIERIEVIRGPGSALYGSNAFNGVVNIITKHKNTARVQVGHFGHRELLLSGTLHLDEWELFGSVNWRDESGDTFDVEFDRFQLQTTTSDPNQATQMEFGAKYQNFSWQNLWLNSERENFYLFRRLRDGNTFLETETRFSRLKYDGQLSENLNYSVGYEYFKGERLSLTALEPQGPPDFVEDDFLFGAYLKYLSERISTDFQWQWNNEHSVSFGGEWVKSNIPVDYLQSNYNLFGNEEYLGVVTPFREPGQRSIRDVTRKIIGAYAQIESQWTEHWQTNIGFRFDGFNDVDDKANPRVSMLYHPNKHHQMKWIIGEAYRAPSLGDLYDEESGLTLGNEFLKPTTLQSYEWVYEFFDDHFYFSTVLFHNHIDDVIAFRADQNSAYLDNVASSRATGIEIEWRYEFEQIALAGSITHLFSNRTEMPQADSFTAFDELSPDSYAQFTLSYELDDQWGASFNHYWRSAVAVLNDSSSLHLSDVNLNYRLNADHQFTLSIDNLFNKTYSHGAYIPLGTLNNADYQEYPARERQIIAGYQMTF